MPAGQACGKGWEWRWTSRLMPLWNSRGFLADHSLYNDAGPTALSGIGTEHGSQGS
jgi:hypothetical protein